MKIKIPKFDINFKIGLVALVVLALTVFGYMASTKTKRALAEGVFEGTLEVYIAEGSAITQNLNAGPPTYEYYLNLKNGQKLKLHFKNQPKGLKTGDVVKVAGFKSDDSSVTVSGNNTELLSVSTAINTRKTAVLLFNFADNQNPPTSVDLARSITYTGTNSANAYYEEVSNGLWGITGHNNADGDVYGPYTLTNTSTNCSYNSWALAAQNAAAADGFDMYNYNNLVYNFPQTSSCFWYGLGTIGGGEPGNPGRAWVNGQLFARVLAHELGHNFSLSHAHSKSCTDESGNPITISTTCVEDDYGDPFDVMGNSSMNHFSNFAKSKLGWIPEGNVLDITSDGDYVIAPQEMTTSVPQTLRIPRFNDLNGNVYEYYFLEFRQPYGQYDNFTAGAPVVNGVSIRTGRNLAVSWDIGASLLDANPSTLSFNDSALGLNKTFYDAAREISVKTIAVAPDQATVRVHFGPVVCTPANPTVGISPSSQTSYAGTTANYTLTVTNNDDEFCQPATFLVTPTLPPGWSQTSPSITLAPGITGTISVGVTSATNSATGPYQFTETVTNNVNSTLQASASATYTVNPGDTTAPVVNITQPANGATVRGNFTIASNASDASGIASIKLYVDTTLVKTCNNVTSCSSTYNANNLSKGNHTIKAIGTDKGLPVANTTTKTITVKK